MERLRGARPAPIHVLVLRCAHVLARQRRVFGAIGEARPGSRALARQRNCSGFRSGELHGQLTRHGGAFCSLCPKILSALSIYASCFCPLPPAPAQDDGKMWGPLASSDQNGPGLPSKSLDFVFRYSPLLAPSARRLLSCAGFQRPCCSRCRIFFKRAAESSSKHEVPGAGDRHRDGHSSRTR